MGRKHGFQAFPEQSVILDDENPLLRFHVAVSIDPSRLLASDGANPSQPTSIPAAV
jgi:hypothetical protein